jgi:hypothetical protein
MSASSSLSASTKRAIARIRRLCCLGLGGQIAVPALLSELHALIPSGNNFFHWVGPDQEIANVYGEGDLLQVVPLYFSEFHLKSERDVIFSLSEVMRRSRKRFMSRANMAILSSRIATGLCWNGLRLGWLATGSPAQSHRLPRPRFGHGSGTGVRSNRCQNFLRAGIAGAGDAKEHVVTLARQARAKVPPTEPFFQASSAKNSEKNSPLVVVIPIIGPVART